MAILLPAPPPCGAAAASSNSNGWWAVILGNREGVERRGRGEGERSCAPDIRRDGDIALGVTGESFMALRELTAPLAAAACYVVSERLWTGGVARWEQCRPS